MKVSVLINRGPLIVDNNTHKEQKCVEAEIRQWSSIKNAYDSRIAVLPVNSVGKILNHKGYDISTIISSIPFLYETSICIISEPESIIPGHKRHPNIAAYYHYLNYFKDSNGDDYFIRFTLFEEKSKKGKRKNIIHSIFVSDSNIYKKKTPDSNMTGIIAPDERIKTPSDLKLQHFFLSVNIFT